MGARPPRSVSRCRSRRSNLPKQRYGRSVVGPAGSSHPRRRSGSCSRVCAAQESISELCRREGIAANLYYRWSKDFLEAGKKQLAGDTVREATSDEVKELRAENRELEEVVAEVTLKNRVLKKSWTGHGEEDAT